MADELVTLEQVKQQLRLETADTDQDGRLNDMRVAARALIEEYVRRDIVATWPNVTDRQRVIAGQAALLMIEEWFVRGAEGQVPIAVTWMLRPLKLHRI